MEIKIGQLRIGRLNSDLYRWNRYLLPKAHYNDRYLKDTYFKFYYRWLIFYWYIPRKCDQCDNYVDKYGSHHIYDCDGKIIMTVCHKCYHSKEYTDIYGRKYCGSIAWMEEQWDKENSKENRICQRYI